MTKRRFTFAVLATAGLLAIGAALAQMTAPDAASAGIVVRIVAADMPDQLISDLEAVASVEDPNVNTIVRSDHAARSIGDDATLWVRGARVNGTNGFERYHLGTFTYRKSELEFAPGKLTAGEHVIDPGGHVFRVEQDGTLSSSDPDISIEGRTVTLKAYRIEIMSVDANKSGPPETRLLGRTLNVFELLPGFDPAASTFDEARTSNALSHFRNFSPLRVYLPANTNKLAYLLQPGKQPFRVLPGGAVELDRGDAQGIQAEGSRILLPYLTYSAWVRTKTALGASFAGEPIPRTEATPALIRVGPTIGDPLFRAGIQGLAPSFGLTLSGDASLYPNKFMVADNTRNIMNVRLMALESGACIFERGGLAVARLQYRENYMTLTPGGVRNAPALIAALNAARNKSPVAGHDRRAALGRSVCEYLLGGLTAADRDAMSAWLDLQATATGSVLMNEAIPLMVRINELLNDRVFFDKKALDDLNADEALRAEVAGAASLKDDQLQRLNWRLLELVFPGVFASPPAEAPARPRVRLAYSPFDAARHTSRSWTFFDAQSWEGDTLTFQTPDVPYGFYMFRVMLFGPDDKDSLSPLMAEFSACVIEPKQEGTASFVSNKGRDAFVPGETIRLQAVLRSRSARPAGPRTLILKHPNGREDRLAMQDSGGAWASQPLSIPDSITRRLVPGRYELTMTDLPPGLSCYPFRFDMAPPRESLFRMIKASKYTHETYSILGSQSGEERIDLDRAVSSLAELGYNRFDYHTYSDDHHSRKGDARAVLAEGDARLMPPSAIYLPSGRDQILNACVRYGLEYGDVLHGAGDNEIPRYIDGYINAGERWIRREVTSMRHSPAYDGQYLYEEAYERGLVGVPMRHDSFFPDWRMNRAAEIFTNMTPNRIRADVSRNVALLKTAPAKWDPQALDRFLELRRWEMNGWGDFNTRLASAGRELLPRARIGTYHCSFMFVQNGYGAVCSATDFDNGYHPDVFQNLEIASCQHYHDGPTIGYWTHAPIMIQLLRDSPASQKRLVWANISMNPDVRTLSDGQLQRQMALAMLAQGADGISTFHMHETFADQPNPNMIKSKETMRLLNKQILAPFGEVYSRATKPGYLKVGIVNTLAQLSLSEFKDIRTANQLEELWVSCWRLGYPAVFLREGDLQKPLDGYELIFVPGIRFPGELTAAMREQLGAAIKRGCKVVVERDSTLDAELDGVIKMTDFDLMNFFYGPGYNVAGYDAELDMVFNKSQAATDYLRSRMVEWGIEPAARGPFTVGPNWRDGGDIQYLIMSNYEDPDYGQTSRDIMSKPVYMPLAVPARRGEVAYDLLARTELPLVTTNGQERAVVLDMTRVQGALAAFLPEKIGALRVTTRRDTAGASVLLTGTLIGESGKPLSGVFPAQIRLLDGKGQPIFSIYRALDSKSEFELALPLTSGNDGGIAVDVVENISGKSCRVPLEVASVTEPALRLDETAAPHVLYPAEVQRFLQSNTNALLVLGRGMDGAKKEVDRLVAGLGAKGIKVTLMPENRVWRVVTPSSGIAANPHSDGFHYWHGGYKGQDPGSMEPRTIVNSPLIILSASHGSLLLNKLVDKGFVTERPVGEAGLPVQPTIQVASRGLHWKYDTLLLVANDAEGVGRAVSRILDDPALSGAPRGAEASPPRPTYGQPEQHDGRATSQHKPATSFMGNNEYVIDMKFDAAGNTYVITWGHGDNLYSLDPQGKLRFSRRLPEMGPCRLDVDTDRVVVFTGYGSRIYQVALDGTAISQARLTLDPGSNHKGPTYRERHTADLLAHGLGLNEELFRYSYTPGRRLIAYYEPLLEKMRVLDQDYNLIADLKGEAITDEDGNVSHGSLGAYVCSPDGTRLAQIEDGKLVLRDLTDPKVRKLATAYGAEPLSWRQGDPGPTAGQTRFNENLQVIGQDPRAPTDAKFDLGPVGGLIPDGKDLRLVRVTPDAEREVSRLGPFPWIPTFVQASPDGRFIVLLDEYWNVFVHEAETGKRSGQAILPEMGFVLKFTPDGQAFMVGGLRGAVMRFDMNANLLWNTSLMPHNQSLKRAEFPNVDTSIPDHTEKLFAPLVDEPGELDTLVTMDRSRLENGDFEADSGWQIDTNAAPTATGVVYADGGHQGKRCLKVGDATVQQTVEGLIGDHFTWVLEFYRRGATPDQAVKLMAGLGVDNRHPDSVVRVLDCGKDWQFTRLTLKSGGAPTALRVGFQGQGGDVLVDDVTLRRIRFPSVNHMLHPPVYDVEPIVLSNPLYYRFYNPLGLLREQIPNVVMAQRPEQIADALLADPFLQNGRVNEISSDWYHSYIAGSDTLVSLGIKEPRWISMVAVYFNAYDDENTTRHFDIYVSDLEQKKVTRVAAVRNNRSLFRLVKFPARRADEVRVVLVNTLPRQRTLTEVEVYGPLSGDEKQGFVDEEGQNTYMGSFARVEKRKTPLAAEYLAMKICDSSPVPRWATPVSQLMMSERNVYLSRALGFNQRLSLDAQTLSAPAVSFRTGGMGFGPVATLYGGALLKPGTDGKLWCIDPGSGRSFWSTDLGDRLTGSPVVMGLDVYMATDAAKLYTLDIASGALLGETKLSGPVHGSVATDGKNLFMISSDGRLHGIQAGGGALWGSIEVAPYTDSTPAVDGGTVYMADQKGTARAVQIADGKVLWSHELGSEFSRCPVVLPDRVVLGCSDGRLTALRRSNGEPLWQTQLKTRFLRYDPVPLMIDVPGSPAIPGSPEIPAKPAVPAQPEVPATATSPAVPAVPEQPAVAGVAAVAAVPAVPAGQTSVLLCMNEGSPVLIGVADGQPTKQQVVTGSVQKDGTFKPDAKPPGIGELTAPISYYKGYLAFVPIDGDSTAVPMFNDSRYHNMGSGAAFLLKPMGDVSPAAGAGPRGVARLNKPVTLDGVVDAEEWGKSLLSLGGPEDIFPTTHRAQGTSDGSTTWNGYDDLGARVYLGWDDQALCVAVKVEDERHFNAQPRDTIWNGDAIQMGLAAGNTHWNLALALTEGGVVFRQFEGAKDKDLEKTSGSSVIRDGNQKHTFYEMRLPLADLGLKPGDPFSLNVCILDDDKGSGSAYWLQTSPGLLGLGPQDPPPSKSAEKVYPRFVLEGK